MRFVFQVFGEPGKDGVLPFETFLIIRNLSLIHILAGCVWIIAGINILRIGIITWLNDAHYWLFKVGEAIVVFLLLDVYKRQGDEGVGRI